jgi:RNA polymerase sigma-70 factor (ECF subfamily)
VNSALQRARRSADERLPERSQQATLRSLGDARVRELVDRYMDAWERGDVDALAALLAEDATFAMPPYPEWCRGRLVAFIRVRGRGRGSGLDFDGRIPTVWTVRGARVVRVRAYRDDGEALKVAGLSR